MSVETLQSTIDKAVAAQMVLHIQTHHPLPLPSHNLWRELTRASDGTSKIVDFTNVDQIIRGRVTTDDNREVPATYISFTPGNGGSFWVLETIAELLAP